MLPQNFYNEQVCIVLAFWLLFVVLATVMSLVSWFVCCTRPYICHVFHHFGAFGGEMHLIHVYSYLTYSQNFLIIALWSNGCYKRTCELVEMSVQMFNVEHDIQVAYGNQNGTHAPAKNDDPGQELNEIVADDIEEQL